MNKHLPILVEEIVTGLDVRKGKRYIDATYGFGGHARSIAERGGEVLGIERDAETVALAKEALAEQRTLQERIHIVHASYVQIKEIAAAQGFIPADGILFDLGFSSWQLNESGRGFSFSQDEELDMRFDKDPASLTGMELLNHSSAEALTDVFSRFAEEENSEELAHAIVRGRPLSRTTDLVRIVSPLLAPRERRNRLARIFQAVRIAVNKELAGIQKALPDAIEILRPGGRIAVISFHSLEDRIVKQVFNRGGVSPVTKKPLTASWRERKANPRARSAKLRIAQKIIS